MVKTLRRHAARDGRPPVADKDRLLPGICLRRRAVSRAAAGRSRPSTRARRRPWSGGRHRPRRCRRRWRGRGRCRRPSLSSRTPRDNAACLSASAMPGPSSAIADGRPLASAVPPRCGPTIFAKRAAFSIRLPRISDRSPSSIGAVRSSGDVDREGQPLASGVRLTTEMTCAAASATRHSALSETPGARRARASSRSTWRRIAPALFSISSASSVSRPFGAAPGCRRRAPAAASSGRAPDRSRASGRARAPSPGLRAAG